MFPGICPKCHAVNADESLAREQPSEPAHGNAAILSCPFATAWPRYLARTFDVFIEMTIVVAVFAAITLPLAPGIPQEFFSLNAFIAGVILLPFALVLDTLFHITVKNTPGKALLGLRVRDIQGNRLSPGKHVKRNSLVWVIGYWLGVPFFEIVPKILQWDHVRENKPATYDEMMGVRVWAKPGGFVGKAAFAILFIFLIVSYIIGAVYRYKSERHAIAYVQSGASSSPSASRSHRAANRYLYYWVNPVTHSGADIPNSWKIKARYNPRGEKYWMFPYASGRVIVFLGDQEVPGESIEDYKNAYMKAHEKNMSFEKNENYFKDHGYLAWSNSAVLRSSRDVGERIEILKKGDVFWRIVVFKAQVSPQDMGASNKLKAILLSTIY